jgi:hypothetical protein
MGLRFRTPSCSLTWGVGPAMVMKSPHKGPVCLVQGAGAEDPGGAGSRGAAPCSASFRAEPVRHQRTGNHRAFSGRASPPSPPDRVVRQPRSSRILMDCHPGWRRFRAARDEARRRRSARGLNARSWHIHGTSAAIHPGPPLSRKPLTCTNDGCVLPWTPLIRLRDAEVAGSNPAVPTARKVQLRARFGPVLSRVRRLLRDPGGPGRRAGGRSPRLCALTRRQCARARPVALRDTRETQNRRADDLQLQLFRPSGPGRWRPVSPGGRGGRR